MKPTTEPEAHRKAVSHAVSKAIVALEKLRDLIPLEILLTEEEETNDPLGQAYNLIEEAWYRFLLNTASPAEAIEWMDIDKKEKEKE